MLSSRILVSGAVWSGRVRLENEEMNRLVTFIVEGLHYSHLHRALSDLSQKHGGSRLDLDVDLSEYKLRKRKKKIKSYGSAPGNAGFRPTRSDEPKSFDRQASQTSSSRTITVKGKSKRNRSKSIDDSLVLNIGSLRNGLACHSGRRPSPRDDAVAKQIGNITRNMASVRASSTMEPFHESPEYIRQCVGRQDDAKDALKGPKESEKGKELRMGTEKGGNEVTRKKSKGKKKCKLNVVPVTESPSPRHCVIRISPRRSEEDLSLQSKIETVSMASPHLITSAERLSLFDSARNRKPLESEPPHDFPSLKFKGSDNALSRSSSDELIRGIPRNSSLEKAVLKKRRSDETSASPPKDPLRISGGEAHRHWHSKNMPSSSLKVSREGKKGSRKSDEFEEPTDTLMLRAIQHGSIEQLLLLLVNGAEIHPYTIHMICSGTVPSPVEKLKILLDNGGAPYVSAHDQHCYTPLHYLLQRMNTDIHYCLPLLELLVNHGVDADMIDKYGISALLFFLERVYKKCSEGNLVLRLLLQSGNPYQTFEGGYPILEYSGSPSDLYGPSLKFKLAKEIIEEAKEQFDAVPFRIPKYPYYGSTFELID